MPFDKAMLAAVEARILGEPVDLPVEDPTEEMGHDILRRVLAADSIDEALEAGTANKMEAFDGVPLSITGITFRQSDYQEGCGVYVLIEAFTEKAERPVVITSGASNVVAQCTVACREDDLPFKAKFKRSEKQTRNGFWVWWLEPA